MSVFPPLSEKVEIKNRDECPVWTQVGGTTLTKNNLQICFPAKYFEWTTAHLRELVAKRPPAHPQSQLFWALDCWSSLNYLLLATNCPQYSPFGMFDGYGVPSSALADTLWSPDSLSHRIYQVMIEFWKGVLQGQKNELMEIKRAGANPAYIRAAEEFETSRLLPANTPKLYAAPFTSFVPWWYRGPGGRGAISQNEILEGIVTAKVLPWMKGGLNTPSFNSKDKADIAKGQTDLAWLSAAYSWRLWSLRDFSSWAVWKAQGWDPKLPDGRLNQQVPRGMSSYENMATMSKYLEYLASESRYPKVEFDGQRWFPNLAFVIDRALVPAANQAIGTYYSTEVKGWISVWSKRAEPKMGPDGQPAMMTADRYEPVPVTCEDYKDLDAQQTKRVEERSRKTSAELADNPKAGCQQFSGGARAQCERAATYYINTANSIPFVKQFMDISKKIAQLFSKFAPMAVGWSYLPYIPIGPLFTRCVDVEGWRAVPNGSSADVLTRMRIAVTAIANELNLHIMPWATPMASATGNVTIDPEGNPVFVATGQPGPPAAEQPWSRARCGTEADKAIAIMKTANPGAQFSEGDRQAIFDCCMAVMVNRTTTDQGACLKKIAQIVEIRKTQSVGPSMQVPTVAKKGRYVTASGAVMASMLLGIRSGRR